MFRENRAKILFLDSHAKIFQVCTYLDVIWQDLGKIYPVSICFLSRLSCFVSLGQRWGADLLGSRGGCRRSTRCRLSWTVPGPGDCSHWRTSLCQSCSSSRCSRTVLWSSCPCTVCTARSLSETPAHHHEGLQSKFTLDECSIFESMA